MAQFSVYRLQSDGELVVDCQSELLEHLNTRLVVPMILRERAPMPAQRLNPVFTIDGTEFVMVTQFASAVQRSDLGETVASLEERAFDVIGALDVLMSGV